MIHDLFKCPAKPFPSAHSTKPSPDSHKLFIMAQASITHLLTRARYVLTHFVVFNHVAMPFRAAKMEPAAHFGPWVEMFLMPTFCFMSGALSSRELNQKRIRYAPYCHAPCKQGSWVLLAAGMVRDKRTFCLLRGVIKLAAIFLMANLFFLLVMMFTPGIRDPEYNIFTVYTGNIGKMQNIGVFFGKLLWSPYFHIWYMLTLPCWRVMDSLLGEFSYPMV